MPFYELPSGQTGGHGDPWASLLGGVNQGAVNQSSWQPQPAGNVPSNFALGNVPGNSGLANPLITLLQAAAGAQANQSMGAQAANAPPVNPPLLGGANAGFPGNAPGS